MTKFYPFVNPLPVVRELGAGLIDTKAELHEQYFQACIFARDVIKDPIFASILEFFMCWGRERRPYYLMYPTIIPALQGLSLGKVSAAELQLPKDLPTLYVRFPVGNRLLPDGRDCPGIVIWNARVKSKTSLSVSCFDPTRPNTPGHMADANQWIMRADPEKTVQEEYEAIIFKDIGRKVDSGVFEALMPIAVSVCLLAKGSDLLEPAVLSKDERRARLATPEELERLIDKCRRRGNLGWHVGREIEMTPHKRKPHPALYWTGPGRQVPRIMIRKGSLIHSDKLKEVPTDYAG